MPKSMIYCRIELPALREGSCQTFGDLSFYPNGGVRLGPKWIAYRTPIHRHRFGANLVACRLIDEPNLIRLEIPGGNQLWFQYRPIHRKWYQLVEVDDPRLYLHQQRYGTQIATGLYYARWIGKWFFTSMINWLVLFLVIAALAGLLSLFD